MLAVLLTALFARLALEFKDIAETFRQLMSRAADDSRFRAHQDDRYLQLDDGGEESLALEILQGEAHGSLCRAKPAA